MPAPLSQEVINIWDQCIWQAVDVLRFTPHIHPCDKTNKTELTCDMEDLIHCGELNFVQYFIQRYRRPDRVGGCLTFRYRVRVEYYLEDSCDNQNKIQEFFEVLDDTVEAQLQDGTKFTFRWEREDNWPQIQRFGVLESRTVFVGSFTYFGEASAS